MKLFSLEAIATSNSVGSLFSGVLIIFVAAVGTYHSSGIILGLGGLSLYVCALLPFVLEKFRKKSRISPYFALQEEAVINQVRRVGNLITRAAGVPDDAFSFFVSDELDIYGYAHYPEKAIVITYGLYRDCRSEDELAAVLGHEIGHMVSRFKYPQGRREIESHHDTDTRKSDLSQLEE